MKDADMHSESCSDEEEGSFSSDAESEKNSDISETKNFRDELADIPLGELQKLKETVGLKKYTEALFGKYRPQSLEKVTFCDEKEEHAHKKPQKEVGSSAIKKKIPKSEPEEKSSKLISNRPRNVVEKHGRKTRDPRFDNVSGNLNEDLFKKSYSFVDEIKKKEVSVIRKQLKKTKGKEKKEHLSLLLQRIEQKDKINAAHEKHRQNAKKRKNEELDSVKQGKKAFYLKNSDKKKIELAEKYRELKKTGQLEKYLGKKYKRNASKQKKNLPNLPKQ